MLNTCTLPLCEVYASKSVKCKPKDRSRVTDIKIVKFNLI